MKRSYLISLTLGLLTFFPILPTLAKGSPKPDPVSPETSRKYLGSIYIIPGTLVPPQKNKECFKIGSQKPVKVQPPKVKSNCTTIKLVAGYQYANLYSQATTNSSVIAQLKDGASVCPTGITQGSFRQVKHNQQTGWLVIR